MGIIAETRWKWSDVDELTLGQVSAMNRYWRKYPPVHMLKAAEFGYPKDDQEVGDTSELIGMLQSVQK